LPRYNNIFSHYSDNMYIFSSQAKNLVFGSFPSASSHCKKLLCSSNYHTKRHYIILSIICK